MGSRIAVLNGGIIQQLGAPQELYDHPANLFVAGFIGSPAMNFFTPAKVVSEGVGRGVGAGLGSTIPDENTFIVVDDIGQMQVPPLYVGQARAVAGRNLTFGIRPEHLSDPGTIDRAHTASLIEGIVDVVEHLGSELQVYVLIGGKTIVARLDPHSDAHVGGTIALHVDTDQVHLFDTDTREAIF